MIGNKIIIAGMNIEIVSDKDDKWETRNLTTDEIVLFDKSALDKAIKLGMAEKLADSDDR